jgi:dephospho-CoA kinase
MSEADARARMAAQPTTAQRRQVADRTLANDGSRADLEAAVDALWAWLQTRRSNT